jgi:hypothetical protein
MNWRCEFGRSWWLGWLWPALGHRIRFCLPCHGAYCDRCTWHDEWPDG